MTSCVSCGTDLRPLCPRCVEKRIEELTVQRDLARIEATKNLLARRESDAKIDELLKVTKLIWTELNEQFDMREMDKLRIGILEVEAWRARR